MFGFDDFLVAAGIWAVIGLFVWGCTQIFKTITNLFRQWQDTDVVTFITKDALFEAAESDPISAAIAKALSEDDDQQETTGVFYGETDGGILHYRSISKKLADDVTAREYYAFRTNPEQIYYKN